MGKACQYLFREPAVETSSEVEPMGKETARNELTGSGKRPSTRLRNGRTVGRKDKGQGWKDRGEDNR